MEHQTDKPARPFPVATHYRDGTPIGEAPDHRAVVRAINHGGMVPTGEGIARELIAKGMKDGQR